MTIHQSDTPVFVIDSYPDLPGHARIERIREIPIKAKTSHVFTWLKQLRVAPYSYDWLDNTFRRSPPFIIENLPPLTVHQHFLLAFQVHDFEEDKYVVGKFCEPIISPYNRSMKSLFIEYRIKTNDLGVRLYSKISGQVIDNFFARFNFLLFCFINRIMVGRQFRRIKQLSERMMAGKTETGLYPLEKLYPKKGLLWWLFCRRKKCPAKEINLNDGLEMINDE